ncbi:MAG: methyltransferase domain-containing protein [Candidatus Nitronauta litoralis]|uniref:Methyltransferase domain-containing protein n=1 Tax=Candidatus Nitronauta litoralis TaxID=2705533 RepID=A0A7T0BW92_9BACT|nr:MAG: methyltransferase domain-containing protein [Candidatus Nitronauta litoralis]
MNAPINKHSLPFAIQDLIRALEEEEDISPRLAQELLIQAELKVEDLEPWADFDHPVQDSYGRKLVFDGGYFEMMCMSWNPGDCSGIHDHGFTQWGAVQIFGPAEHSVFLVRDGEISTLSRVAVKPGTVVAVGNQLVHQMGNPSNTHFLTFHLYGCHGRNQGITADARLYDLVNQEVSRSDGGVFYLLPENQIKRREKAPTPDFLTGLRDRVEMIKRLDKIRRSGAEYPDIEEQIQERLHEMTSLDNWDQFEHDLKGQVDETTGHMCDMGYWHLLRQELIAAAALQKRLIIEQESGDPFFTYAELYDDVVGQPCLDEFIEPYLRFVIQKYQVDLSHTRLLSIGCGTGLVEDFMVKELGLASDRLLGIDKSEAMVQVASRRITARSEDILALEGQEWDITYCGLNVFQYLTPEQCEQALKVTANITKPGGLFIGDFITPDHVRVYPHVIHSKSGDVISLRHPELVEQEHFTFQRSEILNVSRQSGKMLITNEGKHLRFLPPVWRLRQKFETAFRGTVDIYDAVSLEPLGPQADTCPSTRYLLVARKEA